MPPKSFNTKPYNVRVTYNVRVLFRKGPGDTYKVAEREITSVGEHFVVAAKEAAKIAYAARNHESGDYLVQDVVSFESRPFRCQSTPTVREA